MRALTQRQLWIRLAVALLLPLTIGGLFLGSRTDGPTTSKAAVVDLDTPAEVDGAPVGLGRELAAELVNGPATENLTWVQLSAADAAAQLESGELAAVVTIPADFSTDATAVARGEEPRRATIVIDTSPVTTLSETVLTRAVASAASRAVGSTVTSSYLQNAFVTWRQAGTALANTSKQAETVAGQAAEVSKQASGNAQDAQAVANQMAGVAQSLDAAGDPAVAGDPVGAMTDLQGAAGAAKEAGISAAESGKDASLGADDTANASTEVAAVSTSAKTDAAATQAAIAALQLQAAALKKQAEEQAGTAAGYQAEVQSAAASQKALQTQVVAVQTSVNSYVNTVAALADPKKSLAASTGGDDPNPLSPQLREQATQLRALADAIDAQDLDGARAQAQGVADDTRLAYTAAIRYGHDLAALRGQYANNGVDKQCPYQDPQDCRIWKDGVVKGLELAQQTLGANEVIHKTQAADESAHTLLRQLIVLSTTASDLSEQARASADALDKLAATEIAGGDVTALQDAIKQVAEQGGAVNDQAGAAASSGEAQVAAMAKLDSSAGSLASDSAVVGQAAQAQADSVEKVNESMAGLSATLESLQSQADGLVTTAEANNEQSAQLASELTSLAVQAGALATQTDNAASTVSQASQGQGDVVQQVRAAAEGANQLAAGAQQVSDGVAQVSEDTSKVAATAQEGVEAAPDLNGDSQRVIDVLAEPVDTQVNSPATVTWITLVVILAIWIGAMALAWGIPVSGVTRSSGEASSVLREVGIRVGIAVVQALMLGLIAYPRLTAIGPQTDQMIATIAISSVVFTLVNLALAIWLRGWGMVVSVILAVITLAAAASPAINTGMSIARNISPASIGLDAIRTAAVTGSASAGQTALLLVWAAGGVVFATLGILRRRGTDDSARVA